MKKKLSLILIVMSAVFAVSCGGSANSSSNTGETSAETISNETIPAETISSLTVDDLLGKEFSLTNMYTGKDVTIAFSDTNMIGGKSAVNNYFTEFTLDGDKISFKALGSTKMAGPEEDMAVEDEYLQILSGADTISLNGDVLTITTASGTNLIYTYKGNIEAASSNVN